MKSGIKLLIIIWACIHPLNSAAQSEDPHEAQPERPTVATHAGTVATGWLEIEAGSEFDHYSDNSRGVGLPRTVKLGLSSDIQFSVFASAVRPPGANALQIGDLAFGLKWRLADDLPVLGKFAILPSIKLPTGTTAASAGTGTVDGNLLLISSHELGPVALDINLGYTRRSGDGTNAPRTSSLWTISFGGPAAGALGWVAEIYGFPGTSGNAGEPPVVAALFGPTYTLEPWIVFDLGIIEPFAGPQPHAVYCGCVWNIGRVWG